MDYVKKRVVKPENIAVAQDPIVQRHIGELRAHLDAALLVLADSAARWDAADMVERGLLANRAKYLATEASLAVTSRVIQVVGGRGAYKDYLAERAFRDVRTSTLMPPTVDRMLEAIGKQEPDIVFLCSPNNPTGNTNTEEEVQAICQAAPGLVILDEAYVEFAGAPPCPFSWQTFVAHPP